MRNPENIKSRAQRYPIRFGLSYRKEGDRDWHEGKTINFSRTGILFRADQALPRDSQLELFIRFPYNLTVLCNGPVVRSESPEFPATRPALAVQIRNYQMISPTEKNAG